MGVDSSKIEIFKSADFEIQIVYIGVIDPVEFKSGMVFELGLLLDCDFGCFRQNL